MYKDYVRTCPPVLDLIQLANLCQSDRYKVGISLLYLSRCQVIDEFEHHVLRFCYLSTPMFVSIVLPHGFIFLSIFRKTLYVLDTAT